MDARWPAIEGEKTPHLRCLFIYMQLEPKWLELIKYKDAWELWQAHLDIYGTKDCVETDDAAK